MNPLTKEQVEELDRLDKAATKGPWVWNLNLKSKDVSLEGQTGMRETVIDAQRWGMGGAKLRFLRDGLMVGCDQLAKAHEGREHHKHWCADIDHPDAQIITALRNAAPSLLAMARAYLAEIRFHQDEITLLESELRNLRDASWVTQMAVSSQRDYHLSRLAALQGEVTTIREVVG